jgi:hypothetical protein
VTPRRAASFVYPDVRFFLEVRTMKLSLRVQTKIKAGPGNPGCGCAHTRAAEDKKTDGTPPVDVIAQ